MYMYPLSFQEFLRALGKDTLYSSLETASPGRPLSDTAHQELLSLFKVFLVVGGMPEAVSRFVETGSMLQSRWAHEEILTTLYDDFGKYAGDGVSPEMLNLILRFILSRTGMQISYNKNSIPGLDSKTIAKGLEILNNASLIKMVYSSSCSSLPISSSVNPKRMKALFIDTGLYLSAAGLDVSSLTLETDFNKLNIGNVCELAAGLELIKAMPRRQAPGLYFWTRDSDSSNRGTAEVDYVMQCASSIVPVEVKARTQGGMKSLWAFLDKGVSDHGVRASLENFGQMDRLEIYPIYGIGKVLR